MSLFRSGEIRMNRIVSFSLVAAMFALLCVGAAFGQGGAGELTGLVTDPTGAVVSNTTVTLTNSATGEKRTSVTTGAGIYRFVALPVVGSYTLETSSKGFKKFQLANIVISVGAVTSHDIQLEVGAGSETVSVEAGSQIIQTQDSSTSELIDHRVWDQMPLEARNSNDFINLVAGAVPEQLAGGTFRGAAVNGTRTGTGNYMIEGLDNNEQGQGGVAVCGTACGQGGANTSISPDAIQEYRVITHGFDAEYGKAGGFVTDMVLKSGTNRWHGSAFEYNRIQALTANDWFSNNVGARDHLVRNQFGGSIGGPIVRDKTFFYATFEAHKLRESFPVTGTSMTQQFYDFVNTGQLASFVNASNLCGGGCPNLPTTVGSIFQSQRSQFPLAMPLVNSTENCSTTTTNNCVSQGLFSGFFGPSTVLVYPVPVYGNATEQDVTPIDQYRGSIKVDQTLSTKDVLHGVYTAEDVHFQCMLCNNDTGFFGVAEDNPNRTQTGGITWDHTFSPTVLNQAKIGYVRHKANFFGPGSEGIPEMLAIDALVGQFGGSTAIPQLFTENQFQYKDDITITKGKHGLKFGGEYRRTRNGSSFKADQWGHFWSWSAEDLITDSVFSDALSSDFGYQAYYGGWYQAGAAVLPATGQLPNFYRGYRANEYAFYGQDQWRATRRLTLNLGMRWEYTGPPHNFQPGFDSNLYFGPATTPITSTSTNPFFPFNNPLIAGEATATFQQKNSDIWNKDKNNFGPRAGFALDVFGNSKFIVRGGGGIFYDRLYNNVFENMRFNPPAYADENTGFISGAGVGPTFNPGLLTIPFTSTSQFVNPALFPFGFPKPVPRHIDQNLVNAYYEQWNFGFEYALGRDFALETNYVGTGGRKLVGILNLNTFDGKNSGAGSTSRPNPLVNSDNARGNWYDSNYNALNVTLRKKFSYGLSFNANYTYAKALDDLSDVFRAKNAAISVTDNQNPRLDYGPADFDVRHRFVFSYNYDLPLLKGNRWLGGWSLNGIFSANTGSPVALLDAPATGHEDGNYDGVRTDRPRFTGSGSPASSIVGKEQVVNGSNAYVYLDPSMFARVVNDIAGEAGAPGTVIQDPLSGQNIFTCPASVNGGFWCNSGVGRGAIAGPKFVNFDFGISKAFKITEGTRLRFDANFFNIFNHPNFKNPQGNFFDPAFGQAQATYGDTGGHRVTQLALRFDF
jgi:hypothetical protein